MKEITIVGNIGRDVAIKELNGRQYLNFPVAVTEQKKTQWFDVLYYQSAQSGLGQYLTKGRKVLAVGDLSASAYVSKVGDAVPTLTCWARRIELLGDASGQGQSQPQNNAQTNQQRPQQAPQAKQVVEEDLPF